MMYNRIIHDFVCSENDPVVRTDAGRIRGFRVNGINTFLGVRYAQAERFMAPQPVSPWEGVAETLDYGCACPSRPKTDPVGNLAFPSRYWPESEHCQTLNIWTQSLEESAKRPVVVWLHGGGFTAGSCIELESYDGENMCRYGNVVQVSLNHRLNLYGFLDLSDYGSEYALSGNVGMEDIVAALRWIQSNISRFGGDPRNVTIFGESGGGGKVCALMQMADADGLYARAIVDSGILPSRKTPPEQAKAEAKALAKRCVDEAGGLDALKAMTPTQLLALQEKVSDGGFLNWGPVPQTGSYVGPWDSVGFRKETLHIPLIAGSVFTELVPRPESVCDKNALTDEQRVQALVEAYGEQAAPAIAAEFRKAYPEFNLYYASLIDCMIRRPTSEFCRTRVAAGGEKTYNFLFAHETYYKGGLLTTHADELAFVFHNVEYTGAQYGGEITYRLENQIFSSFMAFAAAGDPNNAQISAWPPVRPDAHNCFVFSKAPGNRVAHDEALMELVAASSKHALPHFLKKPENE